MFVKNVVSGNIAILNKIRISLFKPQGLKQILESIPSNNYVLGVGYEEGDYQICISGKKKFDETLDNALNREMYEELSLLPKIQPKIEFRDKHNHFYKINVSDTVILNSYLSDNLTYDTKDRVIACVYGSEVDILDYLENVNLDKDNEDNITHIWTDKAENLLKHVKRNY